MVIISSIILAAGISKRFPAGKLIQKIIVDHKELSLIKYIVEKFKAIDYISEIVVVIGHDKLRIMNSINDPFIKFVLNPNYMAGMSYSVKAGVRSVIKYADIVVIHPGDVPFIKVHTIDELIRKAIELYRFNKEFIVIPKYGVKGGHPLIISRGLIRYVLEISEETRGLKGFLNRFRDKVIYYPTSDLGVLYDIDRPEDLEKAQELFKIKWIRK